MKTCYYDGMIKKRWLDHTVDSVEQEIKKRT